MSNGFLLIAATYIIATALTSAQQNRTESAWELRPKPPASLSPPSEFGTDIATTKSTTTTKSPKPATTTKAPKPTTTTKAPKPTTKAPTPKPTTKAPTPKSTTKAPTPKPTTKAPTPKPTTTTPKPTTTPPKPQPTPTTNATVGNYTLFKEGTRDLCVMAQMELQIRLENKTTNGTFIVQPKLTTTSGSCDTSKANLTLTFKEGFITLLFNRNDTSKSVYVSSVAYNVTYAFKPEVNSNMRAKNASLQLFRTAEGHSYSCTNDSLSMGNGQYLDITHDRMQAFNFTSSNQFGPPEKCKIDQPDYRVAIAVGIVLLILIIIVVLCYIISRRRRADGYQSL